MDMWVHKDTQHVSVANNSALYQLIEQARAEAEQLAKTIQNLSHFELDIQFSVQPSAQAGDMDAASSAISAMPMK